MTGEFEKNPAQPYRVPGQAGVQIVDPQNITGWRVVARRIRFVCYAATLTRRNTTFAMTSSNSANATTPHSETVGIASAHSGA